MKGFFIDLTLCTACRGCQVACKQWKDLPAEHTHNWGSHQNPKELSGITYKVVHFTELPGTDGNRVDWVFFPEQCRHCIDPPCIYAMEDVEGASIHDEETGAIVFTNKTKDASYDDTRSYCPYDIPRQNAAQEIVKCDMCNDRVHEGKLPACVLTCPTGAMVFGDYEEIYAFAEKRLHEVLPSFPEASLGDPDSVRVIYLFPRDPAAIFPKAVASVAPVTRRGLFAMFGKGRKLA